MINDIDSELFNFWRIVKRHLQPFLEYFKYAVISRELFNLENKKDPTTLTDLERAVRYYYLQSLGFGGKPIGRTFGACVSRPTRLNLTTIEESLLEVHWRLERVTIEHLTACRCIEKYDRKETFFYIDPPYYHMTQDYVRKFEDKDFQCLADALSSIKGRFILSLNDDKDIRAMFKRFHQIRVSTKYSTGVIRTAADTRSKERSELLIHNLA